jgi:2-methylcitrate dehydratase PrpD
MDLTKYVAEWTVELRSEDVHAGVWTSAVEHVLDGYGLALGGRREPGYRILGNHLAAMGGEPEARALGLPLRLPAEAAALLNAFAMHVMDFDDTQLSTNPQSVYGLLTHPTTPVLGAAAAVADLVDASGQDLLLAYVAGIEVACRIADAIAPRHYQDGFHTTGTVGGFGAVAAAGKLLGLSVGQLRRAFGIVGGLSGGLRENFGTMTKPLHAGNAARIGVFAARLAANGFTAAESILEAPRGFFRAAAGGYEPDRIENRLGKPFYFEDPGISIKPYPSGSLSHPGQDAVLELVKSYDIKADEVETAVAATNSAMPNALIYPLPQTALEAKFSFPFFLAIAILRRKVTIAEFSDEVVRSAEVQSMMKRCQHIVDPEIDARGFQHMETRIEIRLRDGRLLERTERFAEGHPLKPMNRRVLESKFSESARASLDPEATAKLTELIWQLESLPSIRRLHALMAGPPLEAPTKPYGN